MTCAHSRRISAGRRGFTLLEVLIAIAVFVVSVSSILALFSVGTAAHRRGIDQSEAALLAARVAARVQEDLVDPDPADIRDARAEEGGGFYRYDVEFAPLDRADRFRSAFVVRVRVKWGAAGEEQSEVFESVLLRKPPP